MRGIGLLCVGGLLLSCATDEATTQPSRSFESVEDGRYCEVLVVRSTDEGLVADVWTSLPFGPCPQAAWDALDVSAIQADFPDAATVLLNGPRYFLMQEIVQVSSALDAAVHDFGAIPMSLAATVAVDPAQSEDYREIEVARSTRFRFAAGHRVFELRDPGGRAFVMQSFARIVDPDLTYDDLSALGDRLDLPAGWTYSTRVLEADLDVRADGTAVVVQDELKNTYQWAQ